MGIQSQTSIRRVFFGSLLLCFLFLTASQQSAQHIPNPEAGSQTGASHMPAGAGVSGTSSTGGTNLTGGTGLTGTLKGSDTSACTLSFQVCVGGVSSGSESRKYEPNESSPQVQAELHAADDRAFEHLSAVEKIRGTNE